VTAPMRPKARRAMLHDVGDFVFWLAVVIALALAEFPEARVALLVLALVAYIRYREAR
jgi:hypothetical protein